MSSYINHGRDSVFDTAYEKIYALQRSELLDSHICNYCLGRRPDHREKRSMGQKHGLSLILPGHLGCYHSMRANCPRSPAFLNRSRTLRRCGKRSLSTKEPASPKRQSGSQGGRAAAETEEQEMIVKRDASIPIII